MSEEEYHKQMATKDWTTIMSFPMVLLAIQVCENFLFLDFFEKFKIIIGLRQFVDPEELRTHQRAQQTPSPRRMNRRFNSIRQFLQQNYEEQTF